ncbi:MAG: LamG domain-containing protein, partial [Planctomycetes bacterium]|nr:LamG domain-containing protein [Planctomycetota bacterium]
AGPGQDQNYTVSAYLRTNASTVSGLIAHWELDEGAGTVAGDSGPSGYNGTIDGATWISGDSCPWLGGGTQSALDFDGYNDYIDVVDIPGELTEISFAFYLKCKDTSVFERIFASNNDWGTANFVHVNIYDGTSEINSIEISVCDTENNERYIAAEGYIRINRWYHVAFTFDNTTVAKCYIDGQLKEEVNDTAISTFEIGPCAIGAIN